MTSYVDKINSVLAIATIVLEVGVVFGLVSLVRGSHNDSLFVFLGKYSVIIGFLLALGSMLATLFYSEVAGYEPCMLCWIQRIFMYPLVLVFGVALFKKDFPLFHFAFPLACAGALVAIYHLYISYGGVEFLPCATEAVSCTKRYVYEYGYISIPVMSLTGFSSILVILGAWKKYFKNGRGGEQIN